MTDTTYLNNVPAVIWLQLGMDYDEMEGLDFNELYDVTWCVDKVNDTDIRYVLADDIRPTGRKE